MYNCALSACKQNDGNCRETEVVQEITATVSLYIKKGFILAVEEVGSSKERHKVRVLKKNACK